MRQIQNGSTATALFRKAHVVTIHAVTHASIRAADRVMALVAIPVATHAAIRVADRAMAHVAILVASHAAILASHAGVHVTSANHNSKSAPNFPQPIGH